MRTRLIAILTAEAVVCVLSGCGAETLTSVSVQSVSMLCGFSEAMQSQQFTGIVSTGKEQNVSRDSNKKIAVVYVKEGDQVKEGDKLFTYDSEQAQNSLERARLELEQQNLAITQQEKDIEDLKKLRDKASASLQMDYTLKVQAAENTLREAQYTAQLKEKEIKALEDSTRNLDVTAPITGRIQKAGTADTSTGTTDDDEDISFGSYGGSDDSSDASAFIRIVENENFRIKGTINEQNIRNLYTGMEMTIHSRIDPELTWTGTVTEIDTKSTVKNNDDFNYYGNTDEQTTSSKYAFYVSIDSLDGLMIGQHVFMYQSTSEFDDENEIRLDSSFINDADTAPWIWAENEEQLLEKRNVTVADYDEGSDTYLVTDGLSGEDYICPASELYKEGMPCIENNNTSFQASDNTGDEDEDTGDYYEDDEIDDGGFETMEYYDDAEYDDEDVEYFEDEYNDEDDEYFEDEEFGEDTGDFRDAVGFGGGEFASGTFGGAVG